MRFWLRWLVLACVLSCWLLTMLAVGVAAQRDQALRARARPSAGTASAEGARREPLLQDPASLGRAEWLGTLQHVTVGAAVLLVVGLLLADALARGFAASPAQPGAAPPAVGKEVPAGPAGAPNAQNGQTPSMGSDVLARLSHELRTPLNAVIGLSDLLRGRGTTFDAATHDALLGHIADGGRHLLHLINDMLDLSKIEAGKLEFAPSLLNLNELVNEVFGVLQLDAACRHIRLQAQIQKDLGTLVLDPTRLRQILYNLLSNALKFTPEGGVVVVRACAQGALHWRLEVQDSGKGISEADQQRLFSPFQQIRSGPCGDALATGTGLGLALVREFALRQGGSVGLHSAPGSGSVFHVVLPRTHRVAERQGELSPA